MPGISPRPPVSSEARPILGARSSAVNAAVVGGASVVFVLVAVMIAFFWIGRSGSSRPALLSADQQAREGLARLERGEASAATKLLAQARQGGRKDDRVEKGLAASLVLQGQPDKAIESLKGALADRPGDADLWHLLGSLQLQSGNASAAIASLGQAAALSRRWDIWRDLGEAQSSTDPGSAVRSLGRAWGGAPPGAMRAQIAVETGQALESLGRRREASTWYLRALSDDRASILAKQGAERTKAGR